MASARYVLPAIAYLAICMTPIAACQSSTARSTSNDDTARLALIQELRGQGITDGRVLAALERVPRHAFVRPEDRAQAYANRALPIGHDQTISQPYIVALMTQLLELAEGDRVLEVGTGSGYQAAVLGQLAKSVYSIEIEPALADSARQRLQGLGYHNIEVRAGDGFFGWPEAAPFDAIIVTAVAPRIPERLAEQLKVGGRMVLPLGEGQQQQLVRARKTAAGMQVERAADVLFVPMRGEIQK